MEIHGDYAELRQHLTVLAEEALGALEMSLTGNIELSSRDEGLSDRKSDAGA